LHLSNLPKTPKEVSNGFAFRICNLGNLANDGANLAKMPSCGRLCKPDRASRVQMPIPLEMAYFYPLHFVMGVCKQQQMPSQFAKAFGDALTCQILNRGNSNHDTQR